MAPGAKKGGAKTPKKKRGPTVAQRLEQLEQLVAGQRADFDQLGVVLNANDLERDGRAERVEKHLGSVQGLLHTAVEQLNRTTQGFSDVHTRLQLYETGVPAIARVKRAADEKQKRSAERVKKQVQAAVRTGGGASQEEFPHGPAPVKLCVDGSPHVWQLLGLYEKLDPPVPTVGCTKCKYLWTRNWTQPELEQWWLPAQSEEVRAKYAALHFPAEPPYAAS